MRLPRQTVLHVLKLNDVEVECETPAADGRQCCTLISDHVADVQWLPDPVGGDMVKYLARKFGIPSHAFFFDLSQDRSPPLAN